MRPWPDRLEALPGAVRHRSRRLAGHGSTPILRMEAKYAEVAAVEGPRVVHIPGLHPERGLDLPVQDLFQRAGERQSFPVRGTGKVEAGTWIAPRFLRLDA